MPRIFSKKLIFYCFLLLLLDLYAGALLGIGNARPIFLYLFVLYAAFEWSPQKALPLAMLAGALRDWIGSNVLGTEMCSLMAATLLLDFIVLKVERGLIWVRFLIAFMFVFYVLLLNLVFARLFGFSGSISWHAFGVAMGSALYSACLLPMFISFTGRWFHDRMPLKQYELFG